MCSANPTSCANAYEKRAGLSIVCEKEISILSEPSVCAIIWSSILPAVVSYAYDPVSKSELLVKLEELILITIYGDEILIITNEESLEAIEEKILEDLESNKLYYVGNWDEVARYKGQELSIIDMKKIMGRD